jgi:hypothetical protein
MNLIQLVLRIILLAFTLGTASALFVPSSFASSRVADTKTVNTSTAEQQRAVEEVNSLIIGSYKSRLDRVLDDLYNNIEVASKGSVTFQVSALQKVRDDLDERLDSLSEESVSPNRRKILTGVYFYLKSNIE